MTDAELIAQLALAIKENIGSQFNAAPIHPDLSIGDWAASGGVIDLTQVAQSLLPIINARVGPLESALKRIAGGWPKPMQLARETLEQKK